MEDAFSIVLTPIQLAAIISGGTLTGTASNWTRAWGGAKLVFGALEELGAAALLLAPEPTMLTKVGGVTLGAHGADTLQSSGRQLWTGRDTNSLTSDGTATLAQLLGVSESNARQIGDGVDAAIPIAVTLGAGAVRLAAVRAGRIVLAEHEAQVGAAIGGHTIARHIAQTDAQLAARLAASTLPRVSTFASLSEAESAISSIMRLQRPAITAWARTAPLGTRQAFIGAAPPGGIGRVLVRGAGSSVVGSAIRVILKKEAFNGKLYYILTAYPTP